MKPKMSGQRAIEEGICDHDTAIQDTIDDLRESPWDYFDEEAYYADLGLGSGPHPKPGTQRK